MSIETAFLLDGELSSAGIVDKDVKNAAKFPLGE
jgi:hypothetical protein